jgi:hypothetical protein
MQYLDRKYNYILITILRFSEFIVISAVYTGLVIA